MAFRAHELRLMLTVRNEASRTLRRVARDVGRLDDVTRMRVRAQELQNATNRLKTQRASVASEFESLTTGKKKLDLERQITNQLDMQKKAQAALKDANLLQSRNYQQQVATIRQLEAVQRGLASKRISDFKREQLEYRREELLTQQTRLGKQEGLIPGKRGIAIRNIAQAKRALEGLADAETLMGTNAVQARRRLSDLDDQIDLNNHKLRQMNAEISNMQWGKIENSARMISHLGRVLATTGAIGVAVLGLMANNAASFSKEITLAATQARPMGQSFAATAGIAKNLTGIVLDQMQKFPASSQEMANSLYEIFSGTNIQKPKEAAKALELFNKMAVAGGTDLATMTDAGITLFNNFVGKDKEFKNLAQAADLFFSSVRYGRFSAKQFADSLANIIPIAEGAGLKFRDIADAMAILTRQTGAKFTPRDATGLARMIEVFGRSEVVKGLHDAGVEVEDLTTGKMRPLLDIIKDIQKVYKLKPGTETLNFFKTISAEGSGGKGLAGTVQARRVFNFLIKNLKEYEAVSRKVNKTQGEFNASFQALSRTPGVRWDVTLNQLRALSIMVGQEVIPVLTQMAFPLIKLLHWFNALDPSTKKWIATMLTVGAVSSLVVGALAAMVGGALILVVALTRLSKQLKIMERFGKMAGGAALGARALAAEGGFLNMRMVALFGPLALMLPFLVKYHSAFLEAATGARGFEGAIKGIGLLLSAMALSAVTRNLLKIGSAFMIAARTGKVAAGTAGLLLTRLKALRGTWVALIAIEFYINKDKINKLGDRAKNAILGKIGLGHKKRTQQQMIEELPMIRDVFGKDAMFDVLSKIPKSKQTMDNMADAAQRTTIIKRAQAIANAIKRGQQVINRAGGLQLSPTDPQFLKQLQHVDKLEQLYKKSLEVGAGPKSLAAYRKFTKALTALTARSTDEQKKLIDEFLGHFATATASLLNRQQFATAFANLEQLRKAAEDSTDPKVIAKYLKAQDALTKKSTDVQMQSATEAVSNAERLRQEDLDNAQKASDKATDIAKQNAENAKNALQSITTNLSQFYQNALQENKSAFGQLFNGPFMNSAVMQNRNQFGFGARGKDLVADMFSQVNQFSKFQSSLDKLQQRGAPDELLAQIRELGPEGQKQIDALLKLPQKGQGSLDKFIGFFNKGQKLIEQAANADLDRQIKKWESFGKKVARAIMQGISSETPGMEDKIYNRVLGMFPGLKGQAHATPRGAPAAGANKQYPVVHKTVHYNLPEHLAATSLPSQLKAAYFFERNRD